MNSSYKIVLITIVLAILMLFALLLNRLLNFRDVNFDINDINTNLQVMVCNLEEYYDDIEREAVRNYYYEDNKLKEIFFIDKYESKNNNDSIDEYKKSCNSTRNEIRRFNGFYQVCEETDTTVTKYIKAVLSEATPWEETMGIISFPLDTDIHMAKSLLEETTEFKCTLEE